MGAIGAVYVFLIFAGTCATGLVLGLALCRCFGRVSGPISIFSGLLFLPLAAFSVSILGEMRRGDRQHDSGELVRFAEEAVLEYYSLYPDRVRPTGRDEEVSLEGFGAWFPGFLRQRKSSWPEVIRVFRLQGDYILDSHSRPIHIAMDLNRDMLIRAFNQQVQTADPKSSFAASGKHAFLLYSPGTDGISAIAYEQ